MAIGGIDMTETAKIKRSVLSSKNKINKKDKKS
jgi:hypothetical protein